MLAQTVAVLEPFCERLVSNGHCNLGRFFCRCGFSISVVRNGTQHTLAQISAELQLIKTRGDFTSYCPFESQVCWPHLKVHVRHHLCELSVELDLLDAVTEVLSGHAFDVLCMGNEFVEGPILRNPLRSGLLPHLRHTRQVVRRVSTQGRKIRVLLRGQAVFFFHRCRGKAM